MVNCRICCVELISPNNWYPSLSKNCNKICISCCNFRTLQNQKTTKYKMQRAARQLAFKSEIINKYGGKCQCCEIDDIRLLSIDHINGGGNKHRKSIGISAGTGFYGWLKKNNYPAGFQTLCYNCNCALGHLGYCPHYKLRNSEIKTTTNNRVKVGFCRICDHTLTSENQYKLHCKSGRNICKICYQNNERNKLFNKKCQMVNKYGGKCVRCHERYVEFLTIDHVYNDGAKERKETGKWGRGFYNLLLKLEVSDRYQILCYNCNCLKEYYGRRTVKEIG